MAIALSDGADLAQALQQLGAKRVEATLVASLARGQPLGTKEILDKTGLRQPEVSMGMQELRDRQWVASEPVPRQGKGRPMHRYRLVAARDEIRRYYESQAKGAMAAFERALNILRQQLT